MLNALVSSEQVRYKQTFETVCTDGRVPDEIRERVPACVAGNWKGPMCHCMMYGWCTERAGGDSTSDGAGEHSTGHGVAA